MRTAALGLIGLVLAVAVGFGVHLITRDTISLPVVQLEQPGPLAPPAATGGRTTTTTTGRTPTIETETETDSEPKTETEDNSGPGSSGSGRGRGRGRSDDD